MKKEDFYVYVYLDPRKNGNFIYGDFIFEYEPFYVGKGRRWRSIDHISECKRMDFKNTPKNNKIKKILQLGINPIILKIKENLFDEDALSIEKNIIDIIGRKDLNNGPLLNLIDGGIGSPNKIITEKEKNRLQKLRIGKKMSEETKKQISESNKGKHFLSDEKKKYLSDINIGKKHTLESRSKISKSLIGNTRHKNCFHSDTTKKNISNKLKGKDAWNKMIVYQYTLDDIFVEKFNSAVDAHKKTGISQGNINSVCNKKRKQAGGYLWKREIHL